MGSFVVIVALIFASSPASPPVPGRLRAGPGIMSRAPPHAVAAWLLVGLATMLQGMHAAGAAAHHPDVAAAVGDSAVVLVAARADVRAARAYAARAAACGGRVGAALAAGHLDVERWRAFGVLSFPSSSVVGLLSEHALSRAWARLWPWLLSEPALSRAWVRLWPCREEGYRTVSGSCIGKPIFELLAALGTYLVAHDGCRGDSSECFWLLARRRRGRPVRRCVRACVGAA